MRTSCTSQDGCYFSVVTSCMRWVHTEIPSPAIVASCCRAMAFSKTTHGGSLDEGFFRLKKKRWFHMKIIIFEWILIILMDIHIYFIWRSGGFIFHMNTWWAHPVISWFIKQYNLHEKNILYLVVSFNDYFLAVNIATLDAWWLTFWFHIVSVEVFQTKNDRQGFPSNVVFFDISYS